ncbi:MAG: hypothetical protein ACRDOI_01015, partial [Trebonia sp.]
MDRGTRMVAASARRVRLLLFGLLALAVLVGGGLYLTRGVFSAGPASGRTTVSPRATAADIAIAVPPAVVTVPPRQAEARAHPTKAGPSASPSRLASPAGSVSPRATAP